MRFLRIFLVELLINGVFRMMSDVSARYVGCVRL